MCLHRVIQSDSTCSFDSSSVLVFIFGVYIVLKLYFLSQPAGFTAGTPLSLKGLVVIADAKGSGESSTVVPLFWRAVVWRKYDAS